MLEGAVPKGLVMKLIKVMTSVERVKKNGRNDFQKYDYATEADILEAIRGELIKQNVFIFSSVEGIHKEGELTSVSIKNTIVDGDTGEQFIVKSAGTGSDKGDKGLYKALTGANKYFLLKNFLLPTGDDPERDEETGTKPNLTSVGNTTTPVVETTPRKSTFKRPAAVAKTVTVEEPVEEF